MTGPRRSLRWRLVRAHAIALLLGVGLILWVAPLPVPAGGSSVTLSDLSYWGFASLLPLIVGALAGTGQGVLLRGNSPRRAWPVLVVAAVPGIWVPLFIVAPPPGEAPLNILDWPMLIAALGGWLVFTVTSGALAAILGGQPPHWRHDGEPRRRTTWQP